MERDARSRGQRAGTVFLMNETSWAPAQTFEALSRRKQHAGARSKVLGSFKCMAPAAKSAAGNQISRPR